MLDALSRCLAPAAFALRSLWRKRLQYALVFVALTTAFWAACEVLALIGSIQRRLRSDLESIGWDVINVHADPNPLRFFGHRLDLAACDRLAALVQGIAAPANIAPSIARPVGGGEARPEEAVLLIGTTERWNEVLPMEYAWGRFFAANETDACVLDEWVYRRLFPADAAAGTAPGRELQALLSIGGREVEFRVAGVARDPFKIRERLEEWDATTLARSPLVRFMEYKNIYVPRGALTRGDDVLGMVIKAGSGVNPEAGAALIQESLRSAGSTAVAWSRRRWAGQLLDAAFTAALAGNFIWMVILAVTALMVMSVVCIAIRERYVEIAIRRVEGARRWQVTAQLMAENVILSLAAGGLGLSLAMLTSRWLEARFLGWPVTLPPGEAALVLAAGAFLVAVTTYFPSRRAALLDPVEVLR